MTVAGIIAEYDPFHSGHAYHVAETRRITGCDYVIACMDGHFTQRGMPSVFSKWQRAEAALRCGVDAVFELPTAFAVRPAEDFAYGGVSILSGLGCGMLSFGCETDQNELLNRLADLAEAEPLEVSQAIKEGLEHGLSHAAARGKAISEYLQMPSELINQPNLILAVSYIRALRQRHSEMRICPIRRIGDYHDDTLKGFASASAIRKAVSEQRIEEARQYVPEAVRELFAPERMHGWDDILLFKLRSMNKSDFARLPDAREGLDELLFKRVRECSDVESLIESIKSKRYTRTRIQRLITHAFLGMQTPLPAHLTYARLIGMRRSAAPLLKELKTRSGLPIISDATKLRDDPIFEIECRATDAWALMHDEPQLRRCGREFREKFIVVP